MLRPLNIIGWLLVSVFLVVFAVQFWLFQHFTIDDAFITFRYVQQFAGGNGLVFNIGERVEGYSNFLWVILLTPFELLGVNLSIAAKWLGITLSILTLNITYLLARPQPHPFIAPLFVAACAPFAVWSVAGLETPLFTLLLTVSVYAFVREEESGKGVWSGILFALLALTRPEGALFALIAICFRAWELNRTRSYIQRRDLRRDLRRDWIRLLLFALILIPYLLWRFRYYGYLFPNTVYAKSMGLHPRAFLEGIYYLYSSVVAIGGFWLTVPMALVLFRQRTMRNVFLAVTIAVYALVVVAAGGDWMPVQRFLVPVLPLIMVLASAGIPLLAQAISVRWQSWLAAGLVAGQVGYLLFAGVEQRFVAGVGRPNDSDAKTWVDYVRERWRPGDAVAVTDAGGIAYALPLEARVVDMFGLTDEHIAHLPPQFPSGLLGRGDGFGKWDVDYVLSQNPRFVQAHVIGQTPDGTFIVDNTSNRLLVNDPRFRQQYRQVADTPVLQGVFERIE